MLIGLKEKKQHNDDTIECVSNKETEIQKIEFAAGLKVQRALAAEHANDNLPLTFVEISYLQKFKNIANMLKTLECVCHSETFPNIKELYVHLKKQRSWFSVYTCYNCLVTFRDRSTYMKHFCNCTKELLLNLKRIADCPVNPEIKMRLYQNFKCIKCGCVFCFHEDFCSHFDSEHTEILQNFPPYICLCSRKFSNVDDYKQHLHVTCFLRYFCDVCFEVFPTTKSFKLHCENLHDKADGASINNYDTYRKCKHFSAESSPPLLIPSKRSLQNIQEPNANDEFEENGGKTINLPILTKKPVFVEDDDSQYSAQHKKPIATESVSSIKSVLLPCSCPDCGKQYSSYYNMLRHFRHSHDKLGRLLKCSLCAERFKHTYELKGHEDVHSLSNQNKKISIKQSSNFFKFSCSECGNLFKSKEEWTKHNETHSKNICSECGKEFQTTSDLDQHRNIHLNIKVYRDSKTRDYKSTMANTVLICSICNKNFNNNIDFQKHQSLHDKMPILSVQNDTEDNKKPTAKYSFIPCNKYYVSYGGIWDHNKRHHRNEAVNDKFPKKCDVCKEMFKTRGALGNHMRVHNRSKEGVSTNRKLQNPVYRFHKPKVFNDDTDDSESYHTCKKCFKVFSSKCNLKNHMKCHGINLNSSRSSLKTGKLLKTYWCDVCHQACQGYAQLQEHKQDHVTEKTVISHKPEETTKNIHDMLKCDLCSALFSSAMALEKHKEKHEEKRLKTTKTLLVYCKYCKVPFQTPKELNEHMNNKHYSLLVKSKEQKPVDKKFSCKYCDKSFDNAGALSSHQGWHKRGTNNKPGAQQKLLKTVATNQSKSIVPTIKGRYSCSDCSSSFPNDTALQIHILEAHRNINTTVLSLNCKNCQLHFDKRTAYDAHMQLHQMVENQKTTKPYTCKYCSAGFTRNDNLNAHMRQIHKEFYNNVYKCDRCDRSFEKSNALAVHMKIHEPNKDDNGPPRVVSNKNIYFCSICELGFSVAKDLRNHVITAHRF